MANKQKELREIHRLEKMQSRPKSSGYIFYILLIVSLVYIADEIATQIGAQMQTEVARSLFAPIYGDENAVGRMGAFEVFKYIAIVFGFFYRPLSDIFGRKMFLVLNTLGMGLGLFLIGIANDIPTYVIGVSFIAFFTPYDVQVVYITEVAPEKHRAKFYAIAKTVATVGMMLIPLFRKTLMGADTSRWRYVYLAVAVLTALGSLLAIIFARETDPFIQSRLTCLKKTDEERERAKKEKDVKAEKGGFINACKLSWKNKQLRYSLIAYGLIYCGIVMTTYYSITMTYGYAQIFTNQGFGLAESKEMASSYVTAALFLFPIGSAIPQLIQGFVSDKIGRKPTAVGMGIISIVAYSLFILGTKLVWPPHIVGLLCGMAIGSLWASGDGINIIIVESAPTNLRASVASVTTLAGVIFTIAQFLHLGLINIFGDASAGILSIIISIPPMLVGILLLRKVKETKGTDMTNVDM